MGLGRTRSNYALTGALSLALAACGGGGNSNSGPPIGGVPTPTPAPAPSPTPSSAACSLSARQDFVKSVIDEWYLFPSLVDNSVNKASYSTVQGYIDALVAPARAQSKDRGFTYITSIAEENAFFNSGANAGFGVRLAYDTTNNRVFVVEAFESAPAFGVGIDRGTEILAIGTSSSTLVSVASLMASGGPQAVSDALGPSNAGVTRVLRIDAGGTVREVSVTKANYSLDPVSDRYGAKIINDGTKQVGYINLRTFIDTADPDLRTAFASFRSAGINELIVDVRYNGGGLVRIADLMGDLMNRNNVGKVWSYTTLRPSKASENETRFIQTQSQAIQPVKIAFIGFGGTASASELIANGMLPYVASGNIALVGGNTFGKPVGQFGFDKAECDDRLRAVTFKTENANRQGEYFTGLASVFPNTCRATDDISRPLGDPSEAVIRTALDFLGGRTCTPISSTGRSTASVAPAKELITPRSPTAAQHETPGLF